MDKGIYMINGKKLAKIIVLFTFMVSIHMMKVDALVPVTYKCCQNYTDNNGIQLDDFENKDFGGIQLNDFENLSEWIVGGGYQEIDTVNVHNGQQGLKLFASNGNRSYTDKAIDNNFSTTNNFGIWIFVNDTSSLDFAVVYLTSTNWSNKYFSSRRLYLHNGWNKLIIEKSDFNYNVGGENWNNIMKRIRISIYPKPSQAANVTLDDLRFDVNYDWTGASQEIDTINVRDGQQGLKLVSVNGASSYTDKPINNNFSNINNFAIWVYVDNASNSDMLFIYITSTGSTFNKYFFDNSYRVLKTGWNRLVLNKQNFVNTGGESWNNVMNRIRIRIYPMAGKNVNVTLDDLRYDITGKRAKLILAFDDGETDTLTEAYPVLSANDQHGVSFVVPYYVEDTDRWYMNLANLRTLQNAGWDISSHTYNHTDLATLSDSMLISELNDSYDWLVKNKFQKTAGFVAYPFGTFNDVTLDKVKKRYILGRATKPESAQQHFTPDDEAIQYIQRIIGVYNDTTVQSVKNQINDTINSKLLGILMFHTIAKSNPTQDRYTYLTRDLKSISDYIKSRSGDVDVITYSEYVIPNIRNFTPVINKTTRIYSNGTSILMTDNKYDEYMPNMTVFPLFDSIEIGIATYNETGGLIIINENSLSSNLQVSYDIGDRIPNQTYNVKIYWANGTKYQDFNVLANTAGHITYDSVGFVNPRYQVIDKTVPLSIVSYLPVNDPTTIIGIPQTFVIGLNKTANVTWYINGSIVQQNSSVTSVNYTNSSAGEGIYNVTAIAEDGFNSVSKMWNWTVNPIDQARYNVTGYVSDNNDIGLEGVSVQNNSHNNISDISGYYMITGLSNGTYNFSYSKIGYDTGYLEVTINVADNNSANISIYDNTPPMQVTELVNDIPTQTTINLTWNSVADSNYYQVFRDSTSIGYTKNNYWNDTGLTSDTSYQYNVRANDSYNNWGQNSSILNVKTDVQHYWLSIISSLPISDPTTIFGESQTFEIDLNMTANVTWYINGSVVQTDAGLAAIYSNSTANEGIYNVTAIAEDGYGSVTRMWNWTVIPGAQPKYNLSGYVYNNYGLGLEGVLVQNSSYQSSTESSGYYLITELSNDIYNFSYSKTGFITSYQNVAINGLDKSVNVILSPVPIPNLITATIFPANTTPQSIIDINVSISNNDGVEVKADNILLTNNNGFWIGSKTAPSSIGNYILNITAKDVVGNNYQTNIPYKVLNRQGGASISIIPRTNNVMSGNSVTPIIKVKNTQNIDDKFRTYISIDGIPVANQPSLGWFGWTEKFIYIRAGQEISIPIIISVPSGISGTKTFRARLDSTILTKVYSDTGSLRIT